MNIQQLGFLLCATLIVACTSTPKNNLALDGARADYQRAQASREVTTLAADELKQAGDALRLAEQSWKEREKPEQVDHLAYMAAQRVTVAEQSARYRAAQAVIAGAAEERDKMRLSLRTAEADSANRSLALSERNNAMKAAELAEADAAALLARERASARESELQNQLKELNAKKTERGLVVTLGDVLFDTGKSVLLAGGTRNMNTLADVMKNTPELTASIEGHTDSVGSASANYALSQRRADAVRDALVSQGVSSSRLRTRAYGADMPASDNSTASGRQMNRRVEIVFED